MKRITGQYIFFVLAFGLSLAACKKEEATPNPIDPTPPPVTNGNVLGSGVSINATIGGTVVNLANQPIENATVRIGNQTVQTNEQGAFVFTNISTDSQRAYISTEKDGYFHGSSTVNPNEGLASKTKITLLPKTSSTVFGNTTGGIATISNVTLNFEPGDVALANGDPYSGVVNVFGYYLDPTNSSMAEIMPGDLLASDDNGDVKFLESFGMVAVELEGANGEALNIAPGQEVDISMVVPSQLIGTAPGSIPLWYFDETAGYWVEEGSATLQGNNYVGSVSHFTYWNLDKPYNPVDWSVTIECDGNPVPGVAVKILNSTTGTPYGIGYTNIQGEITDPIPMGIPLTMEITDPCGTLVHTQNLGVINSTLNLGSINICSGANSSVINLDIADCNNQPVPYAFVTITENGVVSQFLTDANGHLSASFIHCGQSTFNIQAFDGNNYMLTNTTTVASASIINVGTLVACNQVNEYLTLTLDGDYYAWVDPTEVVGAFNSNPDRVVINSLVNNGNPVQMGIEAAYLPGTYPNSDYLPAGVLTIPTAFQIGSAPLIIADPGSFDIVLTQYATNIGDYFEGTFGGTFNDQNGITRTVSGSFRAQRE